MFSPLPSFRNRSMMTRSQYASFWASHFLPSHSVSAAPTGSISASSCRVSIRFSRITALSSTMYARNFITFSLGLNQCMPPDSPWLQAARPSRCRRSHGALGLAPVGRRLQAGFQQDQCGLDREFITLQAGGDLSAVHQSEMCNFPILVHRHDPMRNGAAIPIDVLDHVAGALLVRGPGDRDAAARAQAGELLEPEPGLFPGL